MQLISIIGAHESLPAKAIEGHLERQCLDHLRNDDEFGDARLILSELNTMGSRPV